MSQFDAHISLTSLAALPSVSGSVRLFTFSSTSLCRFAYNLDFLFFCSISTSMLLAFFCFIISSTKCAVTSTDASYRRLHWQVESMIPSPPFLQGSASSCCSSSVTIFLPVMAGMNLCLSTASSGAMWSEMPGVVLMRYDHFAIYQPMCECSIRSLWFCLCHLREVLQFIHP